MFFAAAPDLTVGSLITKGQFGPVVELIVC